MSKIRLGGITENQMKQKIRKLAETKLKSLRIIRTTSHLSETLRGINIQELDIEDILEKDNESEQQDIEQTEDALADDDVGEEDEDVDYDETMTFNPFEVEYIGKIKKGSYIAEVAVDRDTADSNHRIQFLQVPLYETDKKTDKKLIRDTLFTRFKLFYEMASYIAEKQFGYFSNPQETNLAELAGLNQMDLVSYLQKYNISKEHVSRMLNTLFFRVRGVGIIQSKHLFRRYGREPKLTGDRLFELAKTFLESGANTGREGKKFTRLHEAKAFRKFVKKRTGVKIKLSDNPNEHDQYKNIKNILNKARKAFNLR